MKKTIKIILLLVFSVASSLIVLNKNNDVIYKTNIVDYKDYKDLTTKNNNVIENNKIINDKIVYNSLSSATSINAPDKIILFEDEVTSFNATLLPNGSSSTIKYKDFEETLLKDNGDGTVTALKRGQTNIILYLEDDESISKEIVVTIIPNEIKSCSYLVSNEKYGKIIIGVDENTSIKKFMLNVENPSFVNIYDLNNNKLDSASEMLITTGMKIKLEKENQVYDEATIIIRGDINQDGIIDVSDKTLISNHILGKNIITGYQLYAANLILDDGLEIENAINVTDGVKLQKYILNKNEILLNNDNVTCTRNYLISFETDSATYFKTSTYRTKITSVSFVNYINTKNALVSYDLSKNSDNSIVGWIDPEYNLYIGSHDKIYSKSLAYFFSGLTSVKNYNFENLNTSETTSMSYMFYNNVALEHIDVSRFNTSNVTDLSSMFKENKSLISIDLNSFDTSNVITIDSMFHSAFNLNEIHVDEWDVSRIKYMGSFLGMTKSLTKIDLSMWNPISAERMGYMFGGMESVEEIDISGWYTPKLERVPMMFNNDINLKKINFGLFDVTNATYLGLSEMFTNDISLEVLDLSGFNTSNLTNMNRTFKGCTNLKTIYVSNKWDVSKVTQSSEMFKNATSLVGGNGTTYSDSNVTSTYARIDGENNLPGYLTRK